MNKFAVSYYVRNLLYSVILFCSNYIFIKEFYNAGMQVYSLLFLFATLLFIVSIFAINNIILIGFTTIVLIINSILSYFKYHYTIIISSTLFQSVINTDLMETVELLNFDLIFFVFLFGVAPASLIYFIERRANLYDRHSKIKRLIQKFFLSLISLILMLVIILLNFNKVYPIMFIKSATMQFMPYNYLVATREYYSFRKHYINIQQKNITDVFHFDYNKDKPLTVILVIGESARSDRLGLNGYHRNTTPKLATIENLLSYKQAYSLATATPLGVHSTMKREGDYNTSSLIDVFNRLGFNTYWISNHSSRYELINVIASNASTIAFADSVRVRGNGNNYDENLLVFVQDILKQSNKNLIILHTIGSHRLYDLRYPSKFRIYTPTCMQDKMYCAVNECKELEQLNNSYDNSILYTDHVLSEIINILKGYNAALFYISDHGESLGENGVYAHASPIDSAPIEQLHIPILFWASKHLLNDNDRLQKFNVAKNKINLKIDQSYVFHSILDCMNIYSNDNGIILDKSICNR